MTKPLRVGVLLGGACLPQFGLEILRQIGSRSLAKVAAVLVDSGGPSGKVSWGFKLYRCWDDHLNAHEDPLNCVNGSAALIGAKNHTVGDELFDAERAESSQAWKEIASLHLDVVLDLRLSPRQVWLPVMFGIWSVHPGDSARYRGSGPEGFWEVCEGNPLTGGELRAQVRGGPHLLILARCQLATAPGLSWAANRASAVWAASALVVQKLDELHRLGWDHVQRRAIPEEVYQGTRPTHGAPSSWEVARWLVPSVARKVGGRVTHRRRHSVWQLGVRQSDRWVAERELQDRLVGFRWLAAEPGRWYADPFLVNRYGRTWAFFEDADWTTGFGRLSAAPLEPDGSVGGAVPVVERPYHLSYPCVFEHGGEWFMVPETSAAGKVELLRCLRFPDLWTPECVLLEETAVDTSMWMEDGNCWMFTTLIEKRSRAMQLWLFGAEALTGPWKPHPENPISLDVRNARGAGAIFRHVGRLYRPSQDCSGRYGRAFSLNEITRLTANEYAERPVVTIDSIPGFVGTHTYARAGRFEMIDACALVRRPRQNRL